MGRFFCMFGAAVLLAVPGAASVIISTAGGEDGGFEGGNVAAAAGWTQTTTFTNVTISAEVDPGNSAGDLGTAFLMTQIGPGTTIADQIAETTFTATGARGTYMLDTLFSGLTLGPGTYYLVLETGNYASNAGVGWELTDANVNTDPRVTALALNLTTFGDSSVGPYVPAMNFPGSIGANVWDFTVAGDPIGTASTPEPAFLGLIAGGAMLLLSVSRKWVL